jgi:hypothetical protein
MESRREKRESEIGEIEVDLTALQRDRSERNRRIALNFREV